MQAMSESGPSWRKAAKAHHRDSQAGISKSAHVHDHDTTAGPDFGVQEYASIQRSWWASRGSADPHAQRSGRRRSQAEMGDGFDLNKHAWVEQHCDDDHRRGRRILGEDLPVGAPDVLPML